MSLNLENLDEKARLFMVKEIENDIEESRLYISPRLNENGIANYPILLKEAARSKNDSWLAQQISSKQLMKTEEIRKKPSGGTTIAKVPVNAPNMLAEGEFNRFYCRAICLRAIEEGKTQVRVYRAKQVDKPRPESEAKIGICINAQKLLDDLRTHPGVETALGIPPGPNSGLSVKF